MQTNHNIKHLNDFIKSGSGSTLIWALIMMLVLGLLITGGFAIAASYSKRSVDQHVKKQAYYSALSTTKAISEWLDGTSDDRPKERGEQLAFINELMGDMGNEHTVSFDSTTDESMGNCSTTVSMGKELNDIRVSTTAEHNGERATVYSVLKKSIGEVGGEGDSPPSDFKLMVPPASDPRDVENSTGANEDTATEEDGQKLIKRMIDLDFDLTNSFRLGNRLSPNSDSVWASQYYSIKTSGENQGKEGFLKLTNDNFPATDSSHNEQDRHMALYSQASSFGTGLKSFTFYTDDSTGDNSDPPRRGIFILPEISDTVVENPITSTKAFGFKALNNTEYRNTHIQINDTGATDGSGDKAILNINPGVHLTENSSIFTRRDTFLNRGYRMNNGLFWSTPDNSYYKRDENGLTDNPSDLAFSGLSPFSLEGRLIVADNTTSFRNGIKIQGDVIIQKTSTNQGKLEIGEIANGSSVSGGSIYIKDGGVLDLGAWNSYIFNDIFVEPGGTVILNGAETHCNVYALNGRNKSGEPALIQVCRQTRFYDHMETLDGNRFIGGIYLGATNESDGAVLEKVGNGYISQNHTTNLNNNIYSGTIHAMPGADVDGSSFDVSSFCDAVVHNKSGSHRTRTCSCAIKVPKYGNLVNSWQIQGYGEK